MSSGDFPVETAALLNLVAAGFRLYVQGDPEDPESLIYVRHRGNAADLIRVYGTDECEAVRLVHRSTTRRTDGTTPEVVNTVLGWSGLDIWGR